MPTSKLFQSLALLFLFCSQSLLAEVAPTSDTAGDPVTPQFQFRLYPPATFDTYRLGAQGAGRIGFQVILLNGGQTGPLTGPFTVRMTLPDGVSFIEGVGSNWTCSANGQDITCNYTSFLSSAVWTTSTVNVRVNVAGDIPVPGESLLQATLEHAQAPLPDPLVCGGNLEFNYVISLTQCARWTVPHRRSETTFAPASWSHFNQPMLVGATSQRISAAFNNVGFDAMHGTITARFLIPSGLVRTGVTGQVVWTCTDQDAGSAGTIASCTTPSFFDGMNPQTSVINLFFTVTEDVEVPGPLTIIGTIGHAYQPWPEDFAECLEDDAPIGCSVYGGIITAEPPRAQMVYTDFSHTPETFRPGDPGSVLARFTNIGEGNAGALALSFEAPPGFSYTGVSNAIPAATCEASGDPATGQSIQCSTAAGFGVGVIGQLRLLFDIAWPGALEVPLTASIGDTTRAAPSMETCLAEPELDGCGQHWIPVMDSLFCDRFENPTAGCRPLSTSD